MAIETTYWGIADDRVSRHWPDEKEWVEYYLLYLSEKLADTNYFTDKDGTKRVIPPVNHHPELKEYEVWMGGYMATGEHGEATLWGTAKARNFAQACHIVMCREKLADILKENQPEHKGYTTPGRWDYDPHDLSYWACGLFWSEEVARKQFG